MMFTQTLLTRGVKLHEADAYKLLAWAISWVWIETYLVSSGVTVFAGLSDCNSVLNKECALSSGTGCVATCAGAGEAV